MRKIYSVYKIGDSFIAWFRRYPLYVPMTLARAHWGKLKQWHLCAVASVCVPLPAAPVRMRGSDVIAASANHSPSAHKPEKINTGEGVGHVSGVQAPMQGFILR